MNERRATMHECGVCGGITVHRNGCPEASDTEKCVICGDDDALVTINEIPFCRPCIEAGVVGEIADMADIDVYTLVERMADRTSRY